MKQKNQFELLHLLAKHGIPFVVVGGHAVSFHGYIRATEDVDIVWLRTTHSEKTLFAALSEANAKWISDERDPTTGIEIPVPISLAYIQSAHLMMLVTDYGFLDLFDYIPGHPHVSVDELYNQGIVSDGLRFASLDWIRRMKERSGRPKDQMDLDNLL